jgi:hypothetical protein
MKFAEEPSYDKLRFSLVSALLNLGKVPTNYYDWCGLEHEVTNHLYNVSLGSYNDKNFLNV